jgi:hypothetical protein
VLSHRAWARLYDRDPGVVGRTIRLNDQVFTIVGVMQEEFLGLNDAARSLGAGHHASGGHEAGSLGATQPRELAIIARVRNSVTPEHQATPAPLTAGLIARLSPVFAAFVLVLVAACANVSNVMLARANARHREIGTRLALGASRWRVVRQLLIEGVLIPTEMVGHPPMHYLTLWRMQLASRMLHDGQQVIEVAGAVGYESEAAFSRAFKKLMGTPPVQWRRRSTPRMSRSC